MNTLDDLRTTLDRHAEGLDDTERHVRPVAVRARIRAVRRRRAGAVAIAAAVVLLGGVASVDALRTPDTIQPAGPVIAGVDVPDSIELLEFPYALRGLRELDDDVHLQPSDESRAVILAASGLDSGSATLYADGAPVARVRGSQQVAAPAPIGDGDTALEVRFDGAGSDARAGVAVYEATGELAPGISNGKAVFRDKLATRTRLGAGFAAPGESSVEFTASAATKARIAFYCDGPPDLWINVEIDGEPGVGSSCGETGPDATVGTSSTVGHLADRQHDVRVYLTQGTSDRPADAPEGMTFGAALYQSGERSVLGAPVETTVEFAGRFWGLDEVVTAPATVDTDEGDALLGLAGRGRVGMTWSGQLTQGRSSDMGSRVGAASMLSAVLLAGDRYQVAVHGGEGRILVYRPL